MLTMASFLALIVHPSARSHISRTIWATDLSSVAGLALLDEVGVLRNAAGIQVERHLCRRQISATARALAMDTG